MGGGNALGSFKFTSPAITPDIAKPPHTHACIWPTYSCIRFNHWLKWGGGGEGKIDGERLVIGERRGPGEDVGQ